MVSVALTTAMPLALEIMSRHKISSLIITDDEGQPVGIFTERDLVHSLSSRHFFDELNIDTLMTKNPLSITSGSSYLEAYQLLTEHTFRHLLVVDDHGVCIGVVTTTDILDYLEKTNLLRLEKERYASLFESIRDAMLIIDPVLASVRDVNPGSL